VHPQAALLFPFNPPPRCAGCVFPLPGFFVTSPSFARSRTTAIEWICDTRDSPTPQQPRPTSFMVSSSK